MKARGILLTAVVVLALLFAVLNWSTLFEPARVNLLVTSVDVPLGMTLLVIALSIVALFFLLSLWERSQQLRQVTHQERQIESLQARLDQQRSAEYAALEAALRDRVDELRRQMESDRGQLESRLLAELESFEERLAGHLETVQSRVVLVRNELAADIGELEDRLTRALPAPDRDTDRPAD